MSENIQTSEDQLREVALLNEEEQTFTPRETVAELDQYIIGQHEAKRAVAIALRNRWRRMHVDEELRAEITPKNILMIGPTGVGKTEIARRLAVLSNAPFIKVEATKFTEVGYVGRDVESIIRDLADIAVKKVREDAMEKVQHIAEESAEERILDVLLAPAPSKAKPKKSHGFVDEVEVDAEPEKKKTEKSSPTRELFRKKFRDGELDDKEIEIEVSAQPMGVEIMAPPGMEEMTNQLQGMFQNMNGAKRRRRKLRVQDAFKLIKDEEASKLIDEDELKLVAMNEVEQHGIVFIDEIDKVVRGTENGGSQGGDVSREGVQRDLLPLVEGTTVTTKYGAVKTDHILFIASGAFHLAKPQDLVPELQGRLPIRVELKALTTEDFQRILVEPKAALTKQYVALLDTEKVKLDFSEDGVKRISEIAAQVNEKNENIGARRLHTVMERLLDMISFDACDKPNETITIDAKYVNEQLKDVVENEDLTKYIL